MGEGIFAMNVIRAIAVGALVGTTGSTLSAANAVPSGSVTVDATTVPVTAGSAGPGVEYIGAGPGVNEALGTVGSPTDGAASVSSGGGGLTFSGPALFSGSLDDIGAGSTFSFTYTTDLTGLVDGYAYSVVPTLSFSITSPEDGITATLLPTAGEFITTSIGACTVSAAGGSPIVVPAHSTVTSPSYGSPAGFIPVPGCDTIHAPMDVVMNSPAVGKSVAVI